MKSAVELVHEFPFFAGLDEQSYAEILALGKIRNYSRDELLFLQDEPSKGLFLIQSGTVKIFKLSESGREQVIAVHHPGESVAEVPLFDEGPYPASASAMGDSQLLFIPKADFHRLLEKNPRLSRAIIAVLARRLRKMVALVEDLSLRQLRERLGRFLLENAAGETVFQLKLTNDEIASRLGSVRDVVSRTLGSLQADGLIRLQGRRVEIIDAERLLEGR